MGTLKGDNASYLGSGPASAMPTPPDNIAANTAAMYYQTDTGEICIWVVDSWICGSWNKPVPPPPPGPGLDQWACNAAGYIVYSVAYRMVKAAVDTNFFHLAVNAIIAFVFDSLAEVLIPLEIVDSAFLAWVENWVATAIYPFIDQFVATIISQVFWNKVHCFLYSAIQASPRNLQLALVTAAGALNASSLSPRNVVAGIALLLQRLGIMHIGPIPLSAFVTTYNCTECSTTQQATGPGITGVPVDITVTDGTTYVPFTQTIKVVGGSVSGTSPLADIIIPSINATDGTTTVFNLRNLDFSGGVTVSDLGSGTAGVHIAGGGGGTTTVHTVLMDRGSLTLAVTAGNADATAAVTFAVDFGGTAPAISLNCDNEEMILNARDITASGFTVVGVTLAALPLGVTVSATVRWAAFLPTTEDVGGGGGGAVYPFVYSTPPDVTGWTWVNQGDAAITAHDGVYTLDTPGHSGDQVRGLVTAAPTAPWTATAALIFNTRRSGVDFGGMLLRDSGSGHLLTWGLAFDSSWNLGALKWCDPGSYCGDYGREVLTQANVYWFRVANDGTNISLQLSGDGTNFLEFTSQPLSDFLSGLDQIGIGMNNPNVGIPCFTTLLSWKVTTP